MQSAAHAVMLGLTETVSYHLRTATASRGIGRPSGVELTAAGRVFLDHARNMLPPTVISRPLEGAPPMIDLVLGYSQANTSPLLKTLLNKLDQLKFRVEKMGAS